SLEEVGWYGLAYKIIENGLFFPAMLGGLLLPHISSAIAVKNMQRVQDIVSQGLLLSSHIGVIIITMLIVFARPIVAFIAGAGFNPSVPLLRVLSIALAIMFLGNIFGFALIALSRQRTLAVLYGFLVFFNIISNVLLIPEYGALAAAWITVATEAIAMLTGAYIVHSTIRYRLSLFPILLATCSALFAVYIGSIFPEYVHIGFRLAFVGALYAGTTYCLGLWNKKTLSILRTTSSI
ncbi:MAG: polysaccharide biosynthesis C-terminal domain-containing protein, partial [Patescibacteria group bacterium]